MKKIIFLSLFLLIISLGCVSAEDVNSTDDVVTNSGVVGDFDDLQELIDNAEGNMLELDTDYMGSGMITINKDLVIDGKGHYIDADSESCILYISDCTVVLHNITFYNAFEADSSGGAIYSKGALGVSYCEFYNNRANDGGGAIASYGELYVENSVFQNNKAGFGGSIYAENTAQICNSSFWDESAETEFIYYYGAGSEDSEFLWLENNTMKSPYYWDVWYEGESPIESPTYLVFGDWTYKTAENVEIAYFVDNWVNSIKLDFIYVEIYDNSTNELVDSVKVYSDEEYGYLYTNKNLNPGVYRTTGYVSDKYAGDCTVFDGTLTIKGDTPEKITPAVTTISKVNGNQVTLTASISPSAATGSVTFSFGGKSYNANVKNGKASVTIFYLDDGKYTVKTSYGGDDNYNAADAEKITFEIKTESQKKTPELTTTSKVDKNSVTVSATISPSAVTGTVTFIINYETYDVALSNGKATKTISNLPEGTYYVDTIYNGNDHYNAVAADEISFTIDTPAPEKVTPAVTVTSDVDVNTATLTATLSPSAATGTVTFYVNTEEYDVTLNNGKATKTLSDLEDDTYNVRTRYNGDDNYNAASARDMTFTITTSKRISAPNVEKYYGSDENFVITLKDSAGNAIANAKVKITLNGKTYERTTGAQGTASMPIKLPAGDYNVTVEYGGEKVKSSIRVKTTLEGNDLTKMFQNSSQYYIKVLDTKGNPLTGKKVKFNINGVFYERNIDENGMARMNINLRPNEYIITAENTANGEMHSNIVTVLSTIVENRDITKYYRNDTQYTLRLLDAQGKPVGKGEEVVFNINGVLYKRYSNEDGYAKLNINLGPDNYIITADYKGCQVSNSVCVLTVLTGKDVTLVHNTGGKYEVKLVDGQGRPYSGQTITMNINGIFYDRTTDSNGIARLNINLRPATYIITATYNGYSTSNTIKVTPGVNTYECGNGHKLEIESTANVIERPEGLIYGYEINYPDGQATFSCELWGQSVSEFVNERVSYGARSLGTYKGWAIIDYTPIKQAYAVNVPNYTMHYKDLYFYGTGSDNLNLVKRVVDSFR